MVSRLNQALSQYVGFFDMSNEDRDAVVRAIIARMNELNLKPDEPIETGADPYDGLGSGFAQFGDDIGQGGETGGGGGDFIAGSGTVPGRTLEELQALGSRYVTGDDFSQYQQFAGTLAADPFFQSVSPAARIGMKSQFDPLSAAFNLRTAISPFTVQGGGGAFAPFAGGQFSPTSTPSFTQFLGGGQAQPFSTQDFEMAFNAIAPFFTEQGFTQPAGTPGLAALQLLNSPAQAQNIISQYAQSQAAPIFRPGIASNLQNAFTAFEQSPGTLQPGGILGQFLNRGFGGVGGGGFGGGFRFGA